MQNGPKVTPLSRNKIEGGVRTGTVLRLLLKW